MSIWMGCFSQFALVFLSVAAASCMLVFAVVMVIVSIITIRDIDERTERMERVLEKLADTKEVE